MNLLKAWERNKISTCILRGLFNTLKRFRWRLSLSRSLDQPFVNRYPQNSWSHLRQQNCSKQLIMKIRLWKYGTTLAAIAIGWKLKILGPKTLVFLKVAILEIMSAIQKWPELTKYCLEIKHQQWWTPCTVLVLVSLRLNGRST